MSRATRPAKNNPSVAIGSTACSGEPQSAKGDGKHLVIGLQAKLGQAGIAKRKRNGFVINLQTGKNSLGAGRKPSDAVGIEVAVAAEPDFPFCVDGKGFQFSRRRGHTLLKRPTAQRLARGVITVQSFLRFCPNSAVAVFQNARYPCFETRYLLKGVFGRRMGQEARKTLFGADPDIAFFILIQRADEHARKAPWVTPVQRKLHFLAGGRVIKRHPGAVCAQPPTPLAIAQNIGQRLLVWSYGTSGSRVFGRRRCLIPFIEQETGIQRWHPDGSIGGFFKIPNNGGMGVYAWFGTPGQFNVWNLQSQGKRVKPAQPLSEPHPNSAAAVTVQGLDGLFAETAAQGRQGRFRITQAVCQRMPGKNLKQAPQIDFCEQQFAGWRVHGNGLWMKISGQGRIWAELLPVRIYVADPAVVSKPSAAIRFQQ